MTNGDKIRSMTDEELAGLDHYCPYCHECIHLVYINDYRVENDGVTCEECKLDWLKQEAETNDEG